MSWAAAGGAQGTERASVVPVKATLALVAALLASFPALACAEDPPAPPRTPSIYGGEPSEPGAYGAIVALVGADQTLCTGTLVTPSVVLTAAHCLADLPEGTLPDVHHGSQVLSDRKVAATAMGMHPSFCAGCNEDVFDFGYVLLAEPLPAEGGFPAPIVTQEDWDFVMAEGTALTLVGYGESDDAPTDPYRGAGTKRTVDTAVSQLSEDHTEFRADAAGKGTCTGDSGGPALARAEDGSTKLTGVLARGTCGSASFYGSPYPALCWLRDESGANLLPESCQDCDCIETDGGCGCMLPGEGGASAGAGGWLGAALLVAMAARRTAPKAAQKAAR